MSKNKYDKIEKKDERSIEEDEHIVKEVSEGGAKGDELLDKVLEKDLKTDLKIKHEILNTLEDKSKWWSNYAQALADYGMYLLSKIDYDNAKKPWEYLCIPTDGRATTVFGKGFSTKQGLVIALKAPDGKVFVKAMLTTMTPKVDEKGLETICFEAENTVDSYYGRLQGEVSPRNKSGIWMP